MDKTAIGLIADVLYIKGVICFEEFEDIQNATNPADLGEVIEKMLRGEYDERLQGEGYVLNNVIGK